MNPITLEEFLAWERAQPERYEFDGIQPVAMTGGSLRHARVGTRMVVALANRVQPPCEAFGPELKVITVGRVRYPDASVVCGGSDEDADTMAPTIVVEVASPSTALSDRRVKPGGIRHHPQPARLLLAGAGAPAYHRPPPFRQLGR